MSSSNYWGQRYSSEGAIWGKEPSRTSQRLMQEFAKSTNHPEKHILEIGIGYGRDTKYYLENGHKVYASESVVKVDLLTDLLSFGLRKFNFSTPLPHNWPGRLFREQAFDAVVSHRTFHLLSKPVVKSYKKEFAHCIKDDGLLVLSARDPNDFNPEQMTKIGPNSAVYKNRPDHVIDFWTERRFRSNFAQDFDILDFERGSEIESQKNPVPSYFTIMVARRKPRLSREPSQTP